MKKIHETTPFNVSGDHVWGVISNVSRCDWLPTVNHIDLDGDIRSFEMEGMGKIKERIIELQFNNSFFNFTHAFHFKTSNIAI